MSAPIQPPSDFPGAVSGVPDKTERTFGMLCHLLALCGYVVPVVGNIVGPLVLWLIKKDEYPFVDDQGKESVNFQITMTLAVIISIVLIPVLIGIVLLPAAILADLIFIIIATIKANNGEAYRYPVCLRLIK
jgi:hypothetical protein